MNPATPKPAIIGDGRGILSDKFKVNPFRNINTKKSRINTDAHFPDFVLDQN
jgi:hypothetical protein